MSESNTIINIKRINAILYFAKNVKDCGKTKLFKLLYYLDFIHFKKYGFSVTGYSYIAMPYGPVPKELFEQLKTDSLPKEYEESFFVEKEAKDEDDKYFLFHIKPRTKKVDLDWFSPSELEILEQVVDIFKESTAKDMVEASHFKNQPWDKTLKNGKIGDEIDYFLVYDKDSELSLEDLKERYQLQKLLME